MWCFATILCSIVNFATPVECLFQFKGTIVFFLFPFASAENMPVLYQPAV